MPNRSEETMPNVPDAKKAPHIFAWAPTGIPKSKNKHVAAMSLAFHRMKHLLRC
jgi:hypothetical protein